MAMPPYVPVKLTDQGRLFLDWLSATWTGWTAYTQQFPL
jgi:hypothetical protein